MKKYTLIKSNGEESIVQAKKGNKMDYKELQAYVKGTFDIVGLKDRRIMYVNDNGKLNALPINHKASDLFIERYPLIEYPENNDQTIVGDVLIEENVK